MTPYEREDTMMIRNNTAPAEKPGYEPTGEGAYARCPDHGSRLWWDSDGHFYCPAEVGGTRAHNEDDNLAPADIYVEHDEAWRVVNGCLFVDSFDEVEA
jgi:hypothetical protein